MSMYEEMGDMDKMAEKGRGGDTLIGHLTPGEIVIPREIAQDPQFQQMIAGAFKAAQMDMDAYTVGHEKNSINPETGNPEFLSLKSAFKSVTNLVTAPIKAVAGVLGIGGSPKMPEMPKPQEPVRPAQIDTARIISEERDKLARRRRGRAATILAEEYGDLSMPATGARRLSGV